MTDEKPADPKIPTSFPAWVYHPKSVPPVPAPEWEAMLVHNLDELHALPHAGEWTQTPGAPTKATDPKAAEPEAPKRR